MLQVKRKKNKIQVLLVWNQIIKGNIEEFISKNISPQGEVNHNGVVAPQSTSKTVFSTHKSVKEVKLEDFKVLKVIGRGSFGKVCLVEYLPTHEIY